MLPFGPLSQVYEAVRTLNTERLEGDLVECGVWSGGCVGLMALANTRFPGPDRRLHLFDSFRGLPQPSSRDEDVAPNFRAGQPHLAHTVDDTESLVATDLCVGDSRRTVEAFLTDRLGVSRDRLVFHEGWFQDTVPKASKTIGPIALLRLDGDWYDSTMVCLKGLFPNVVEGGFVIIDDYGTYSGCRLAVHDYLREIGLTAELEAAGGDCVYFRKATKIPARAG
jgi:hypothetical protein